MGARLASGVSDEISTTRHESPLQFKQKLVIAFVRRTDGLQILASDRTFPADHLDLGHTPTTRGEKVAPAR